MEETVNITNQGELMISFVVPVYNVEKSLEACVKSLLAQKTQIEIILVDDGSKDNSGAICDTFAANDDRIIAIRQKNGGPGVARNTGLTRARGKYIWFVDSDDWIEDDASQIMLSAAEASGAQITVCGMNNDYTDNGYSFITRVEKPCVYKGKKELAKAVYDMDKRLLLQFTTNKLYRFDFLKGFDKWFEGVRAPIEDALFNLMVIPKADIISVVDTAPYHYMQSSDMSMVRKFNMGLYDACQRVNTIRRAMYRDLGMESEDYLDCCARVCFYQDLHAIVNMYHTVGERVKPVRVEVWKKIFANGDIRDEVRRSRKNVPEARIVGFALFLGTPWAANAFFRLIMAVRNNFTALYRLLRDRILLRHK